ncbi:uncharacterized protein MYCFIDRAFT_77014 [Pseudocercospora fijiensis CIRAD86]|uniref:Uncharacterized protein n=1 Tax=Pseudocercospora fijiensis (strain CIRAD86) TaxID=383855 RepID=M2YTK5_PSEFD|nr:uncharacterized protein MYCFIDRAFT_77014 [Pseudocercospora fijiensis CIRAD86]EME81085.1 hypothetical protein MYCFIDRAFT_77014 [Pseudocercospora fijiensis CIRAD86]
MLGTLLLATFLGAGLSQAKALNERASAQSYCSSNDETSNPESDQDSNSDEMCHNDEHNFVIYKHNYQSSVYSDFHNLQLCRAYGSAAPKTSPATGDSIKATVLLGTNQSECNLICM